MSADRFGLTPELMEHLKREEGLRLKPYLCQAGYPTIGYGHRILSLAHPPITAARAVEIFEEDLKYYRDAALRLSPGLAQHERRLAAIVEFCFNVGIAAYAGSTLRKKVNVEDWAAASKQIRLWDKAYNPKSGKKEPLAALTRRRKITSEWLEAG